MPADAAAILRRWRQLSDRRMVWDRTRQDIADYVLPAKADIIWRRTPGSRKTWFQYDSAAEVAAHRLAARMASTITSPSQKWFSLKLREGELNDIHEVAVWLEECADRMYLAFNQSNFASAISEAFLDEIVFGTGCVMTEELTPRTPQTFGGLNFRTLAFGRYCVAEGYTGVVDTVYRRYELPARLIVQRWPTTCPAEIAETAKTRPDAPYDVVHGVYPRADANPYKRTAREMPVASCYVLEKGSVLLEESGFQEMPYAVPRWTKAADEEYGRGLGDQAYGDIRTLNRYTELDLQAREKAVDPALEVLQDSVVGDITLRPAEINYVTERNAIQAVESKARFDVSDHTIERLRGSIREIFFHDQLILKDSPEMTATEANYRWQLLLQALGSTLPRTQSEGLTPIITRVFGVMMRGGSLPPVPQILRQYGANIDIQYEGPLSRAQRSQDATAIQMWVADMMAIAQAGHPEIFDNLKVDDTARTVADVRGVPPDLLQDQRIMAQIRAARQQVIQQQHAVQTATEIGKAAGPASRMLTAVSDAAQAQQEPAATEEAA